MNVQQLTKTLTEFSGPLEVDDLVVRNFNGPADIDLWIDIQQQAFESARPAARPWSRADFTKNMLKQSWWSPQRMWFAEEVNTSAAIGTVTLAMRSGKSGVLPVVHWLAVAPRWRRLGIARLLLSHLEATCWDQDLREIRLETHNGWQKAA
ncbi:MAG: GNAT family N-acetyltransferase, partial [Planctomycetales bacterium]